MKPGSGITGMVARAGRAFIAAKGRIPEEDGAALAEWLMSGAPILEGDRELLAELVLGKWGRPPTRPETSASHPDVLAVVAAIRAGGLQKQVAHSFGISLRTVANYLKMFEEREKAIADGLAKARQAK